MSSTSNNCCVLLRGKVHFTPPLLGNGCGWAPLWGVPGQSGTYPRQAGPGVFIGNSSQLDVQQSREEFEEKDYTGGGSSCSTSILDGIDVALNVKCFSDRNLEAALFGSTTVSGESCIVINEKIPLSGACLDCGDVIFVAQPLIDCDDPTSMTVRDTQTGTSTTLYEGLSYERTPVGFKLLEPLNLSEYAEVLVSYTSASDVSTVDAFTRDAIEVGVMYDGVNQHDGRSVVAQIYRMRLTASDALSLINSSGFGEITLTGKLLPICVAGKKEYMRIMRKNYAKTCEVC